MKNPELVRIFEEIADILEMLGVDWKPQAFRKAGRSINNLSEDVEKIYKEKGLEGLKEIPGVGEGIGKKIVEFLETNKIKEYEELKKKIPKGVEEMMHIQGLGPKKAWKLYKKLKIDSVKKLEEAAKQGKIRKLEGFGEKSEQDILTGLELFKKGQDRISIALVLPIAQEIKNKLARLKEVKKVDVAGSVRRMKETIGDIDILVVSKNSEKIMNYFTKLDNVNVVLAKGDTKSSVVLKEGINCDLRVVEEKSYGAALNYFTGSKDHNVRLRQIAIKKGLKLSEYGLFDKKNKYIGGKTEEELYKKLGLNYIEPEMRENEGEIELSEKNRLPKLISYNDIRGDCHMHTTWTDGNNTTEEMIKAAAELGYEYIAITDHSKSTYVANGLDVKRLLEHKKEIEKAAKKYPEIRVFVGSEVDILKDGDLDYDKKTLAELDVVGASIHSRFKSTKDEMTKRILKAVENEHVTFIGHPTGRLINKRNPYEIDFDKIFEACKRHDVAMEINSYPDRLDLKDVYIKKAIENKVKLIINTDSHSVSDLRFMKFGIAQARRGWATKDNVLNTLSLSKFEKVIAK